jgi:N-carbamoylputrescine amidase
VKLSWIQGKSQSSTAANLDYYSQKIKEAAQKNPAIIFLPELMTSDYFAIKQDPANFKLALELDSPEIKEFQNLAKQLKIDLMLPFFEKQSSALFFNSTIHINHQGQIVSHYRKMHIPDDPGFNEKYYFSPGDKGFVVTQCQEAKVGLLICWDQWFPEAARITALKGAEILYYPTAIGWDDNEDPSVYKSQVEAWTTIMRAHAIANNVFVVAVNRTGREGHLNFWGHSFVADPFGKILIQNETEESVNHLDIDLAEIESARRVWPFFRDRRVDAYGDITSKWLS